MSFSWGSQKPFAQTPLMEVPECPEWEGEWIGNRPGERSIDRHLRHIVVTAGLQVPRAPSGGGLEGKKRVTVIVQDFSVRQ